MVQERLSIFLVLWATFNIQLILRIPSTKLSQLLVIFNTGISTNKRSHPNGLKSAWNFTTGSCVFVVVMTIKMDEMSWGKGTCWEEDSEQLFVKRNLVDGDYLQDLGTDGRKIFIGSLRNRLGEVDWIDLAQYRGRSLEVLNAVMNFWVI